MLDEVTKALGPWPILQLFFGLAILGVGAWAIMRGAQGQKKDSGIMLEDKRQEWEAYLQLKNIEENTFKQVAILEKILQRMDNNSEQMKALAAAIWNRGMELGPPR